MIGVNLTRTKSDRGRSRSADRSDGRRTPPAIPLFVAGFLLTVGLRSTGQLPDAAIDLARHLETACFSVALVGLGAGVRIKRLRALGLGPLALGAAAWVLVAATSWLGIVLFL